MGRRKWVVSRLDKDLASKLAQRHNIDPFAAVLLASKGITSDSAVEEFFSGESDFCDPFDLVDMDKAADRIETAVEQGERITVYGDYDADGVTATTVLFLYLEMLGARVSFYIPNRDTEGYGLNKGAIKRIFDEGTNLIVTVDNGISAFEEAEYISELGMDLVITDHHKVSDRLPKACAVVDAHRPDCNLSFKDWSGVGIAFKLMCALSGGDDEDILDTFADVITIGTIGDVVPLRGENRKIVKSGLKKINNDAGCAVEALKAVSGADKRIITSSSVAFTLVPRINAIGRMGDASLGVKLLMSDKFDECVEFSRLVEQTNAERQKVEKEIFDQVLLQIEQHPEMLYDRVLVFDGEDWHAGVIGIVAAKLVDRFLKPCLVIARNGEQAKGSARSIDGFSLFDAVTACGSLLTHYGGHTLAAGFSLESKNIPAFRKAINDYAKSVDMPFAKVNIDCKIRPEFISADILPIIDSLEPFGAGNEQPMFGLYSMTLLSVSPLSGGKHVRLTLQKKDTTVYALKFGMPYEDFPFEKGDIIDLAVRIERNDFGGVTKAAVYVSHMRISAVDDDKFLYGQHLFEKIMRGDRLIKSEVQRALPDRAFAANVFRFIRKCGTWRFDTDVLCHRLGDDGENSCKILVSIQAMCEMGILKRNGSHISDADKKDKVNLEDAPILKHLRAII